MGFGPGMKVGPDRLNNRRHPSLHVLERRWLRKSTAPFFGFAPRGFSRQPAIMGVPITPASFAPDACPSQQGFTYERRHPAVATKILRHLGLPTHAVTTAEPCDIWRVRGPSGQLVPQISGPFRVSRESVPASTQIVQRA